MPTEAAIAGFTFSFLFSYLTVGIGLYVLNSVALFKLAKKRGIQNYGLAWLPIGSTWVLGKLADDVNICRRNKKTNFARNLLILNLVTVGIGILTYIAAFAIAISVIGLGLEHTTPDDFVYSMLPHVGILILLALAIAVVSIASAVISYMALYRVFYGYSEDNATVFLVLSIFFPILQPIFLFTIRNRELLPPDPLTFTQNYNM